MAEDRRVKPHIYVGSSGVSEPFTSPSAGGSRPNVPIRNRQQHGAALREQLDAVAIVQATLIERSKDLELASPVGVQVAFEGFPGVELAVESLADARQNIELINVQHVGEQIIATVFYPQGKLPAFEKKLTDYVEERTDKNGAPRDNRHLVDAIKSFRAAALTSLWTDDPEQMPEDPLESFWWEIWLPVRDDRQALISNFRIFANLVGLEVSDQALEFPERTVLLAKGSRQQFEQSGLLLNTVAELRRAKETAAFFDELEIDEQPSWTADLLSRLQLTNDSSVHICVLDTGINNAHPLVRPFLRDVDQHSIEPGWDVADAHGHGTGMGSLAIWGDLVAVLPMGNPVLIDHRLESVKLLRHEGDNDGKHHGVLTATGVALPEITYPDRKRIFALAVSTKDGRDRGKPSAWSSELDSLASDFIGENANPRLFVVSAGNTGDDLTLLKDYPAYNELQDVHDPAQAWNILSIGAYTQKVSITEPVTGISPLAPEGGLSPYSTTSVTWAQSMPLKPEIVFEGGNIGVDATSCVGMASLKLLTSHHKPIDRLFTTFEATSAATALAAQFAAKVSAAYPDYWPETIRGLMVHSAQWSDAMIAQFQNGNTIRQQAHHRVRCVGFGVPDFKRALWSVNNSLSLVVEDSLQPFIKPAVGSPRTNDMHLHQLPWPRESLTELGETPVEMTVTLSYFVEPNPSSRNVSSKYGYPSHQLRFDVKRASESLGEFRQRVNRQAGDVQRGNVAAPADPDWLLGPQFRHKGSVHKDVWRGTAADLAERGQLAIYPAMGWWRTRTGLERYNKKARYSLIVSITAPEVEVDLYTEVEAQVAVATSVEVGVEVTDRPVD